MIKKAENKSNFTILSNAVLLDETISDKARGTLVRLLCRPENWNLNINYMVKTGKDGNTAIRSAIRELEKAGYIHKEVTRHENGRIIGVEYIIHEIPEACGYVQATVNDIDHFNDVTKMVVAQEDHNEDPIVMDTHMLETAIKETCTIINTDTKQILKETTTTHEPEPVSKTMSSSSSNIILNLIPAQHRSPDVLTLVNKAMVDCPENDLKKAILYSASNVKGGSLQFRAYLDKTIKNKWADGWEPAPEKLADRQAAGEQIKHLPVSSLKMLAEVGNLVAIEALKLRGNPSDLQYARC